MRPSSSGLANHCVQPAEEILILPTAAGEGRWQMSARAAGVAVGSGKGHRWGEIGG